LWAGILGDRLIGPYILHKGWQGLLISTS
jgi:hypothetical protein